MKTEWERETESCLSFPFHSRTLSLSLSLCCTPFFLLPFGSATASQVNCNQINNGKHLKRYANEHFWLGLVDWKTATATAQTHTHSYTPVTSAGEIKFHSKVELLTTEIDVIDSTASWVCSALWHCWLWLVDRRLPLVDCALCTLIDLCVCPCECVSVLALTLACVCFMAETAMRQRIAIARMLSLDKLGIEDLLG